MELRISTGSIFRLLKWLVIVAVVIFSILVVINARDEALDPGIASFTSDPRPPVPDAENAFFTLLAFDAPEEMDAHAEGVAWVEQHEAVVKQDPYANEYAPARFQLDPRYTSNILGGMDMTYLVCNVDSNCDRWRTTDDFVLRSYLARYGTELKRYESLYAFPHYRITETPTKAMKLTRNMKGFRVDKMHQIEMVRVALALRDRKVNEALVILARDTAFWRMVLAETSDKDTKWDAADMIVENMHFLGDIIPMGQLNESGEKAIEAMLQPLTAQEMDLRPVMRREFMISRNVIEGFAHGGEWQKYRKLHIWYMLKMLKDPKDTWVEDADDLYYRMFYQPNATVNRAYRYATSVVDLASLPSMEYALRMRTSGCVRTLFGMNDRNCETKIFGEDKEQWVGGLYNPLGKYFGFQDRLGYVVRMTNLYNLQGYIRLLTLQFRAKQANVTGEELDAFIAKAGGDLYNPYTGQRMQYNKSTRKLYFIGMGRSLVEDKRYEVPL